MDVQIENDRLGLGTNLFSEKPTLIESKGLDTVENGLAEASDYYINNFLSRDKNCIFDSKLVTERKSN